MATDTEARDQLSRDLGDDLEGRLFITATSNGASSDDVISTEFLDFDDEQLDSEKMTLYGRNSTNIEVERKGTLSGSTFTATRDWDSATSSGDEFEVHRLFTASEKNAAITEALDAVWPDLFVVVQDEITTVADQLTYDLSSSGFYRDTPMQVRLVSETDTENDALLFDWDMVPDTSFLRLGEEFTAGRTIRLYGHAKPTLDNITSDELRVVTARAAMILYEQAIQTQANDFIGRYAEALRLHTQRYQRRLMANRPNRVPLSRRFSGWKRKEKDVLWDRAT